MKSKHLLLLAATVAVLSTSSAFGATAYDTAVMADLPAGYWPLQDTNGPFVTDLAGTNSGMIQVSTDAVIPGQSGSHLAFAQAPAGASDGWSYTLGGPGFLFGEPDDKAVYFT